MTTPTYTVPHRREREGRTDYEQRLSLLKSREKRVIIRLTNTQVIVQVASYDPDGDHIHLTVDGSDLEDKGWDHNTKNLPAAYLTGAIAADKCDDEGIEQGVLDIGLRSPHKGGRVYAALKGLVDNGVDIPAGDDVFPSEERVRGEHISDTVADSFDEIKESLT